MSRKLKSIAKHGATTCDAEISLLSYLGFIPWGFLVLKFIPNETIMGILLWAWFLMWPVGIVWYAQQKCPRCGKRFAYTLWGQRCAHCGLSRAQIAVTVGAKTSFV